MLDLLGTARLNGCLSPLFISLDNKQKEEEEEKRMELLNITWVRRVGIIYTNFL